MKYGSSAYPTGADSYKKQSYIDRFRVLTFQDWNTALSLRSAQNHRKSREPQPLKLADRPSPSKNV
jgi:hypothetical protein